MKREERNGERRKKEKKRKKKKEKEGRKGKNVGMEGGRKKIEWAIVFGSLFRKMQSAALNI